MLVLLNLGNALLFIFAWALIPAVLLLKRYLDAKKRKNGIDPETGEAVCKKCFAPLEIHISIDAVAAPTSLDALKPFVHLYCKKCNSFELFSQVKIPPDDNPFWKVPSK